MMSDRGIPHIPGAHHPIMAADLHQPGCHCAVESLRKLEIYMYYAIKDRDLVRFRRLLATGLGAEHCFSETVPGDGHYTTVLQLAVQENFVDAVSILLTLEAISEVNIQISFMYAMKYNMTEIIRVFLKAAIADHIQLDLSTAFRHAMYKAQYDLVSDIIKKPQFDVNLDATWAMDRPLHIAVHHNQLGLAEQLLIRGAHVDAEDRKGMTPLMLACSLGYVECTELLLQHGANPNYRGQHITWRQTPLKLILQNAKHSDVAHKLLQLLISAGLNLHHDHRNLVSLITDHRNPNLGASIYNWLQQLHQQPVTLKMQCMAKVRKYLLKQTDGTSFLTALDVMPIAPGLKNFLKLSPVLAWWYNNIGQKFVK